MSGERFGSLMNYLGDRATIGMPEPEIGMGATILMWSDRHAGTVVELVVTKSGPNKGQIRQIKVQSDRATVDPESKALAAGYGPMNSEFYDYLYEPNPNGRIWTFNRVEAGGWREPGQGAGCSLGRREEYRDPTF